MKRKTRKAVNALASGAVGAALLFVSLKPAPAEPTVSHEAPAPTTSAVGR